MSVSISGTVYSDEGVTPLSGKTVAVSINGAAAAGSNVSAGDGTYSITGLTINAGDVLALYLDDNDSANRAVTVTVANGSNLTGIDLFKNYLICRQDNGGSLTNANLALANNNADADITGVYTDSGANVTVGTASSNIKSLYIPAGHTFAPGGNVTVAGSWRNFGTFTAGSGTVTTNCRKSGHTIRSGGSAFNNLTITFAGSGYTLADALVVNGTWTFSSTTSGSFSSGNFAITCGGDASIFVSTATTDFGTSVVTFSKSSGTQTLTTGGNTFHTIAHSGAGTLALGGSSVVTVTSLLDNQAGTITLGVGTLNLTGATFSNAGTLSLANNTGTLTGFVNDTNSGTVLYTTPTGTGLKAGNDYYNLTFNGSGTATLNATLNVNGSLVLVTSSTLDGGGQTINVAGNFTRSGGTFTANGSTVNLTGAGGSTQVISGSTTFHNLAATAAAARTLTFTDGTTTTVTNSLTLTGSAGQLLTLQGSGAAGWAIAVPATQNLDYLSVSRSTATGNTAVATNSVDGGNNVNWNFGAAASVGGAPPRNSLRMGLGM